MSKVEYEVFNPRTGKFEVAAVDEKEIDEALDFFLNDFQVYESEKQVIKTMMEMQLNNNIHPNLDNLD